MLGRGFLMSQVAPKESKEPPKPHEPKSEEPPKLAALPIPHTDILKNPMAVMSSQNGAGNQQVVRGRRVIIL